MAARWHLETCVRPSINISSSGPHCDVCGGSPDIAALRERQVQNPSSIRIPPDEPLGQLNLRWPPTVHYEGNDTDSSPNPVELEVSDGGYGNVDGSPVYERALTRAEIRLLQLSPSPSTEDPVHMTLEVFPQDDCPEYEAVSYTWGGEDGDSTPVEPVHIGQLWDVSLQTRNCDGMLRYLRLKDKRRTLWVDAICINQLSNSEKAMQIPCMATIFKSAMRVVSYLEAPATPGNDRRFPPRTGIGELKDDSLESMLKLRYFSRLWVIQELILARSVVFVFGGSEYHAQPSEMPAVSWGDTPAPWLKHLGARSFGSDESLTDVLRLTGNAACADVRDLCFGALGLVKGNMARGLQPDYTLSARHLFIGLASHCLINEDRQSDVLVNAIGSGGWGRQPSWVPNWSLVSGLDLSRTHRNADWYDEKEDFGLPWDDLDAGTSGFTAVVGRYQPRELSVITAFRPSVDALTGALLLQLIYFCPIMGILRLEQNLRGTSRIRGQHWFRFHGARSDFILISYMPELHRIVKPTSDHIFYTKTGVPLVMRMLDGNNERFSVVAPLHSILMIPQSTDGDLGGHKYPGAVLLNEFVQLALESSNFLDSPINLPDGDRVVDQTLEINNPRLAALRDTKIALRVRRQIFTGVKQAQDTVPFIDPLLYATGYGRDGRLAWDPSWHFSKVLQLANRDPVTGCSRSRENGSDDNHWIRLDFGRHDFDYVWEWYVKPLYLEANDPGGSNRRREEALLWGDLPVWEWRISDVDRWAPVSDSMTLTAILKGRSRDLVTLRTTVHSVILYLLRDCWETEVARKLRYQYDSMSNDRRKAPKVDDPLLGLLDAEDKDGSVSCDIPSTPSTPPLLSHVYSTSELQPHPDSGRPMLVTIS